MSPGEYESIYVGGGTIFFVPPLKNPFFEKILIPILTMFMGKLFDHWVSAMH